MSMFSSGTFWFSRRSQAPKRYAETTHSYVRLARVAEQIFAGGFSGWSRGVDFLAGFGLPGRVCFALDWNSDALNARDQVHAACHVEEGMPPIHSNLRQNISCKADVAFSDAFTWMSMQGVGCWLCSPPCPPFCNNKTRGSKGWEHRDAVAFQWLIGQMKIFRPWIVCFENVPGLRDRLQWAHYQILTHEVVSLGGYSTVDRPRALIIAVRMEGPTILEPRISRPVLAKVGMEGDDVYCTSLPRDYLHMHLLSNEVASLYLTRNLLPQVAQRDPSLFLLQTSSAIASSSPQNVYQAPCLWHCMEVSMSWTMAHWLLEVSLANFWHRASPLLDLGLCRPLRPSCAQVLP